MSLTSKQRLALIDHINALVPVDFERLVFALNAPRSVVPSNFAAQGDRASALLAWVVSPNGCGMDQLLVSLGAIAPLPPILIRPSRSDSPVVPSVLSVLSWGRSTSTSHRILPFSIPLSRRRMIQVLGFTSGISGMLWLGSRLVQTQHSLILPDSLEERVLTYEVVTVDSQGEVSASEERRRASWVQLIGNEVELELVKIPGDSFLMGSKGDPNHSEREVPQHRVSVQSFMMGRYPITQVQWRAIALLPSVNIALEPEPSKFKGNYHPVENVTWDEVKEACDRLSIHTGLAYRLPSEAEWEYACRAGTDSPFHFGKTITSELANYNGHKIYVGEPTGENRETTTPVDLFPYTNGFGLSDMHGNVWEWCQDRPYAYEGASPKAIEWGRANSSKHIFRGGSWKNSPQHCRSTFRDCAVAKNRGGDLGFRVALTF